MKKKLFKKYICSLILFMSCAYIVSFTDLTSTNLARQSYNVTSCSESDDEELIVRVH